MIKPREVRAKALQFEDQNIKFRSFLKNRAGHDELDAQFKALHDELLKIMTVANAPIDVKLSA